MPKVQKNVSGLSPRELIMALIIVVLVFAVGWLVFKQNDSSVADDFATAPVREQLVINEWGVAFDQPSPDATLSYKLDDVNADGVQTAHLSYNELSAIDSLCTNPELATIERYTPSAKLAVSDSDKKTIAEIETSPEFVDILSQDDGALKKIGENYYRIDKYYGGVQVCGGKNAKDFIKNNISSENATDFIDTWDNTLKPA